MIPVFEAIGFLNFKASKTYHPHHLQLSSIVFFWDFLRSPGGHKEPGKQKGRPVALSPTLVPPKKTPGKRKDQIGFKKTIIMGKMLVSLGWYP